MDDFKDKVAIVTGGTRGIGRAIVLKLASLRCHVAFSYLKSGESARALEEKARGFGVKCEGEQVDIKEFKAVQYWIKKIKETFGHMEILINNAGIKKDKSLMLLAPEDWKDVVATNLDGVFNATKSCITTFMKQRGGQIINISSVSGLTGIAGQTNYSASKGGVNAFTMALAKEVASYGITVNAIAPGFIETELLSDLTPERRERLLASIPMGRFGRAEDVADCVAFLLEKGSGYITGQIIHVDGGLRM